MPFHLIYFMRGIHQYILYGFFLVLLISCTGSRKFFKAAEKLEKQGFIDQAANYYLESAQRNIDNIKAKLKLSEVGQKYVSNLSSQFFREFNSQQFEKSVEIFNTLKKFTDDAAVLSLTLDYPKSYLDDYSVAVEFYLNKYYKQTLENMEQEKWELALKTISKVKMYNAHYKDVENLEVTTKCEPLYRKVVSLMEAKNYVLAKQNLNLLLQISESYKDAKELSEIVYNQLKTSFLVFHHESKNEKMIADNLVNEFIDIARQYAHQVTMINQAPFSNMVTPVEFSCIGDIDLTKAIYKATGTDYFYVFEILNKKEITYGPTKTKLVAYEKTKTQKDTVILIEYKPIDYFQVKGERVYAYDFKYQLIDAASNQILVSKTENCSGVDKLLYHEFAKPIFTTIDNFFPYNPKLTPIVNQINPNPWRSEFRNVRELKSVDLLKKDADEKALKSFKYSLNHVIIK